MSEHTFADVVAAARARDDAETRRSVARIAETVTPRNARNVGDILDEDAGCEYHQALVAAEAQGACERFVSEFEATPGLADLVDAARIVAECDIRLTDEGATFVPHGPEHGYTRPPTKAPRDMGNVG